MNKQSKQENKKNDVKGWDIINLEVLQRLLEIQPGILTIGPEKGLNNVLDNIAETANSLLGGNFCIVIPYNHASDRFLLNQVRSGGIPEARAFTYGEPRPKGATRTILNDGEMIIEDYGNSKYIKKYPFLRERVAEGQRLGAYQDIAPVKATIGERLQAGDEYFGVLVINYPEPHKFQPFEVDVAKVFASQAAIAIRNAKLYERYRALINSSQSFDVLRTAQKPNVALETIIQVVHEVLGSELTVVFPYDQKKDSFIMEKLVAIGNRLENYKFSAPRVQGGTRKVLRENNIVYYNLDEAPQEWKELLGSGPFVQHFGIKAVAAIPLKVGEVVLGVLYINYNYIHRFDQAELDLIEAFSNQVALLLYNANVFEGEQRARNLAEALRDMAADLIQSPSLQDALNKTLEQVRRVIPYDGALLMLMEGPRLVSKAAKGFEAEVEVLKFSLDPLADIIFKEHGNFAKPVFLSDVQKDRRWVPVPTVDWVHGWLGVRLFSKTGEIVGEIGLYSREKDFYNQEFADILASFANQAVLGIENALYLDRLKTISQIQGEILGESRDLDRVINTILDRALELVGANIGQILLLEEDKTHLSISASTSKVDIGRLLNIEECITGLVIKENRQVLVRDVVTEEPYNKLYRPPEGVSARSELAVPLTTGDQIIGVLNVESPIVGAFSEYHVNILVALANVTSSAIQTAKSNVRELDLIARVQEIILSEDFELTDIFALIANEAKGITGADTGEVWLLKGTDILEYAIIVPETYSKNAMKQLKVSDSINGKAILQKSPVLISDTNQSAEYKPASGIQMRSELAVPLLIMGNPIGTINVESQSPNAFSRHNQLLLQTLAEEASVAIQAARRRQEQRTIEEIQREMLSAAFDEKKVFDLILERGLNLIGATLGQVLTVDGEKLLIRSSTHGPDIGGEVEIENSVTGIAVKEKRTIRIGDVQVEEPYRDVYQPILGLDLHSEMVVPIISEGEVIGALNIEGERVAAFTDEDQRLLVSLARQAALTLRLAEAFTIVETLRDVQDGILTEQYNTEDASDVILNKAQTLIRAETGQILLLEDPITLVIKASTNPEEVNVTRVKVSDSVSGMAVEQERPINVRDVQTEEPYKSRYKQFLGGNMHSELVVPLRVGERIIGVVNVESPRIGAFNQRHIEVLSTLAGQAAMAFRTAEELELRKNKVEADKMLSAGQIVHRLTGRSGAIRGWIEIIKEEQPELMLTNKNFSNAINDIELKAGEILKLVDELKLSAAGQFKIVDIPPLVHLSLEKLTSTEEYEKFGDKVVVENHVPESLPQVRADSTLSDVFLNLLTNPLKEMPNGGKVEIFAEAKSKWVSISFKDNGPGIPPEMHEKIFDSKFSGSDKPGHGLGLWWSRAYVQLLGGDILLESARGRGACFTVRLPTTQ